MAITSRQILDTIKNLSNIENDLHLEGIPEGAGFWWKLVHMEPAVYRGIVVSVVAILASFGFAVSDSWTATSVTILAAVAAFVQAVWTRSAVTANSKVLAYKPDPVDRPNTILPGDAVSTDVIGVANAAATKVGRINVIPFPLDTSQEH